MHVCHYSKCTNKFLNGVSSVRDSHRPGQAHRVVTPEAIAAVEAIVKENRRVTVYEIAARLDMSHGSAHHIVHDVLQFHKVSARWVTRQLTAELKERRVDVCQEILKHPMSFWPVVWQLRNCVPPLPDHRSTTYWVLHTTSCIIQSNAPDDGQNYCPKHVELI